VAGQATAPKRPLGLKIGIAAGILALVGGGVAVASAGSANNAAIEAPLVVRPEITSAAALEGKTLASPQLGGTQDVALRAWLSAQGYKTNVDDTVINAARMEAAGAELRGDVIERSLKNIVFTVDPLAGTYSKLLKDGVSAGTTKQADINGIFDLAALNEVTGEKTSAAGLGKE